MRTPQPSRKLILFLGLAFGSSSPAGETCTAACQASQELLLKTAKAIKRLEEIKAANEHYLAELDPNEEGQRVKVQSNLRVAEKRIQSERETLRAAENTSRNASCVTCPK